MTKRNYLLSALIVLFLGIGMQANAIDRQTLAKYAASLKGKKGASLKIALQPLLKPKKVLSYGSGSGKTWSGFYQTDRNKETNECYNRYSSKKFYFSSGNTNSAISGMNIEHSFPKSWWGGTENDAYKDLYNLYPSDSKANSSKSNYPMDEVPNGQGEEGYDHVGTGTHNSKAWEPGDQFKGDFARSYMYMAVAYGDFTFVKTGLQTMNNEDYPGLKPWASALYIKWGKQDSVSTLEIDRNNAVAKIESNRNLLIDYPHLAEYIWGDSANVAFDPYSSISTASDDDRYWNGTSPVIPDEPVVDDVYYFSATNTIVPDKQYLIVADNNGSLLAMMPIPSNKTYAYPNGQSVTELNDTISLTSTDNVFTIEANGSGYSIKDSKGRYIYNDGSHKNFNVTTDKNKAGAWTATFNDDGTVKLVQGSSYVQYSTKFTSFGCYPDEQGVMPKLYIQVEKNATGIESIQTVRPVVNGNIYTIQGQFVGKDVRTLSPGLYIKDGKKFVVK